MTDPRDKVWLSIIKEEDRGTYRFMFGRDDESPGLIADIRIRPEDLLEVFMHSGLDFNNDADLMH